MGSAREDIAGRIIDHGPAAPVPVGAVEHERGAIDFRPLEATRLPRALVW